jgi:methylated-DNA-[protein]-cysteine S-methyltransferase
MTAPRRNREAASAVLHGMTTTTTIRSTTIPTPVGPFRMLASADGVLAAGFTDDPARMRALLGDEERDLPTLEVEDLGPWSDAVGAYFAGDVAAIDAVPVIQPSAPFTHAARDKMRAIAPGRTLTYTQLAAAAGRPDAPRAAGAACAGNRAALFVPCHRVVRTDGSLGGYLWGLPVKRWLLDFESAAAAAPTRA